MSGLFNNLKSDGLEEAQDRLGGYNVRETNIYNARIKVAYAGKSDGGAQNVTIVADLGDGEYTETVYVTNRKGENWFLNPNDNSKKVPLPGFTIIDDLCLVATGKALHEQETEDKIVKVYDYDERKEVPKSVPVIVDLIDKTVFIAIVKQTVDKNKKNDSTGEYEPTGETRDENVIEKVFHDPTKLTVVEAKEGTKEPVFFDKWLEKNKGNTRNRAKGSGNTGNAGAPQAGQQPAKKTASLFGK